MCFELCERDVRLTLNECLGIQGSRKRDGLRLEILGTTMADRAGLKFVGFIFASITLAVMFGTCMVVKGYADGAYTLDNSVVVSE